MIKVIAEHSVDINIMPHRAMVLDLGCLGSSFFNQLILHGLIPYQFAIDINPKATPEYCLAISHKNGYCSVEYSDDPQATRIKEGNDIPMMTIETFSKMVGVSHWDLIKMDIEGEEYEVLNQAKHPLATQVSVEFHAHTGRQTKEQLDKLLDKLSEFYTIHNRVWEERHCAGSNYWDVLLIAK